jgi:hypothetical protein
MNNKASRRINNAELYVNRESHPGWLSGAESTLRVGDAIYCTAGEGTVTGIHGRTGDGSRLLEISLGASVRQPFFAAASNVLVPPAKELRARKAAAAAAAAAEAASLSVELPTIKS